MQYEAAILAAAERLSRLDPADVCARTGVGWDSAPGTGRTAASTDVCARTGAGWDDGGYIIPWFGKRVPLGGGGGAEQVLWLHYLTSDGAGAPTGKLIAYRDLRGAGFYEPSFNARAVKPLEKRFGADPAATAALTGAGAALNGRPAGFGDASVTLLPLPMLPVTYIIWGGDGELPPAGMVLFDQTASRWLPAEDLTVLASMGAYKLIRAANELQ